MKKRTDAGSRVRAVDWVESRGRPFLGPPNGPVRPLGPLVGPTESWLPRSRVEDHGALN